MELNRYRNTQFRYASVYVIITFIVLLILNIYCSRVSQQLFYRNKESSMIEKCQLAASEISSLEVLNQSTISDAVSQMGSLKVTRMIVTDQAGLTIYDTQSDYIGTYALLPEIVVAMRDRGNDVFSWWYHYRDGAMQSHAATPLLSYGNLIGCVYMMEYDTAQGAMIESLQSTILQITLILEVAVILFSFAFSRTFSRRLQRIMASMRIIRDGDYTHKVNMGGNDELTFLGDEFNDLTERLNTSEQKRRRFISDASHELKTPLASIKLLTDSILQNNMDADTIREFVSDIGDEAERLNRMTSKMLSLTKADADVIADSEIIYMAPTIERVARMVSSLAQQFNITVDLDLQQDSPVLILEDDLYQIAFNLAENGIKYNKPNGNLSICLRRDDDNAVLQISDTGVGIPEDAIGHIFERFFRVDKARSRSSGGSGLGLAIVRAIVQRNRGEIHVDSIVDAGTTFTVSFPVFDTEVDQE